jgi:hypothetical protein
VLAAITFNGCFIVERVELDRDFLTFRRRATVGNDDFRLVTFAFFGNYYSLCARFLTHDRCKLAQKKLT